MCNFLPYATLDGSVGLYNTEVEDVYHSYKGAASEAYYKFIKPAGINNFIETHSEIKILDICFGIGYNSKIFLAIILKNFLEKSNNNKNLLSPYICKIHTDNTIIRGNTNYNYKIHSDNIIDEKFNKICNYKIYGDNKNKNKNKLTLKDKCNNFKVKITAIESDIDLCLLAPFITSKCTMKNNFMYKNIDDFSKILEKIKKEKADDKYNSIIWETLFMQNDLNAVNMYMYHSIKSKYKEQIKKTLDKVSKSRKFKPYFSQEFCHLFDLYYKSCSYRYPFSSFYTFLHNIYYRNISSRYKRQLEALNLLDIDFDLKNKDARAVLQTDSSVYDFIFLDAFSPIKCPTLWTYDFLKLLYTHLNDDGMLLTYSRSASVRNALIETGFFIGQIFNEQENRYTGTIATKNKDLIKHALTEFDLGLLKTRAGIFYRDEKLNASNEEIILRRETDIKNSNLISSSDYIKRKKGKNIISI